MQILIVDDEPNIRKALSGLLQDEGYDVRACASGEECITQLSKASADVVFLDVVLPGMDGLQTLEHVKSVSPETKVLMMSGQADLAMAVKATKLGAHNFLEKPLHPDRVLLELKNIADQRMLERKILSLENRIGHAEEFVGESFPIRRLKEDIAKAAPSEGRVFIYGENGTGKEIVARAIHGQSRRKNRPFVSLNCAAIPRDLVESELFGYEKGAFTGAVRRKFGLFETAEGGTLFLDEVGDMGPETQAKLLRVLQENEAVHIGGSVPYRFNVRVISATNKDIQEEIRQGRFRTDLWYRLNVIPLVVPPLRERKEDIPVLAEYFLKTVCENSGKGMKSFAPDSLQALWSYSWPGNVRELRNVIERLVIMSEGKIIGETDVLASLPSGRDRTEDAADLPEETGPLSFREIVDRFEKSILEREFRAANGNISELARKLKTDRANLYRKLKEYGIK